MEKIIEKVEYNTMYFPENEEEREILPAVAAYFMLWEKKYVQLSERGLLVWK